MKFLDFVENCVFWLIDEHPGLLATISIGTNFIFYAFVFYMAYHFVAKYW